AACGAAPTRVDSRIDLASGRRFKSSVNGEHGRGVVSGGLANEGRVTAPCGRSDVPGEEYQPGQCGGVKIWEPAGNAGRACGQRGIRGIDLHRAVRPIL